MWTINENQLTAFSNSMRSEFERRACFAIAKEYTDLSESEISRIVHTQTNKIATYDIAPEETMMQFIRLSFEYPVLQAEVLPDDLHEILSSFSDKMKEEYVKLEDLIEQLNK